MSSLYASSTPNPSPQRQRRASLAFASREKARLSPLPSYVDLVEQKALTHARTHAWTTTFYLPSPFPLLPHRRSKSDPNNSNSHSHPPHPRRRLRITLPIPPRLLYVLASPFRLIARRPRRRLSALALLAALAILWLVYAASRKLDDAETQWYSDPSTLVYSREDLRKIWLWEIASGHYPSSEKIPPQVGVPLRYPNPGLPTRDPSEPFISPPGQGPGSYSYPNARPGTGPQREYPHIEAKPPDTAYPPRPPANSVADLDVILRHCDFSQHKYVRDCLELLRLGGGLDNGKHVRREPIDKWKYIFLEQPSNSSLSSTPTASHEPRRGERLHKRDGTTEGDAELEDVLEDVEEATTQSRGFIGTASSGGLQWAKGAREPSLKLPQPVPPRPPLAQRPFVPPSTSNSTPSSSSDPPTDYPLFNSSPPPSADAPPDPCDPSHPRVFHMFWAGPFTDKPYLALLSYLFTQNLGLHLSPQAAHDYFLQNGVCRPQFWIWINPGAAAAVPSPTAEDDMRKTLASNPWSSPFLHPRFDEVIKFKLWNTIEQLDGVPEIAAEWRSSVGTLFNSGGVKYTPPKADESTTEEEAAANSGGGSGENKDLFNRLGSTSYEAYDQLSVVLSDMARFVLCHRFGGTYLDADTILLRDWEELWGWRGAFAYRWSYHDKYNTAVLRMNKGSALGSFLFRTALRNELDFHPMTVSRYTKDAKLQGLLLRLPDALFDPAWLNMEKYQLERPPFPFFGEFQEFFDAPVVSGAAPQALGFDGFFKGAYSYHFHNFWWIPFDPTRNWPDLGPRFKKGERAARLRVQGPPPDAPDPDPRAAPPRTAPPPSQQRRNDDEWDGWGDEDDEIVDDLRDISWATVLKRTFEAYIRGERPNMYGEWLVW